MGASENLKAMLEVRPENERKELGVILSKNIDLEYLEDFPTINNIDDFI